MVDSKIQERLRQLREEINYHNHRYHALDDPMVPDSKFDKLMVELIRLESQFPELVIASSPTQRVGAYPAEGFQQVDHPLPMLSLANSFDFTQLQNWHNRVTNLLGVDKFSMVCELKIDGLAVALTYQDGVLIQGATRGNGYRGEDVTHNLRTIKSIPLALQCRRPSRLEVRGEVFMSNIAFTKLNRDQAAMGKPLYANPRNTAAGSVRQLDPVVTASRNLDVCIYGLGYIQDDSMPDNHWDTLNQLGKLGFRISPHNRICNTLAEVEDYYRQWLEKRDSMSFQADGIVVKINSFNFQANLGVVGREPRWAVAYKFPAEKVITRLLDIGINVGRTGSLNPYAVLEPVIVGGATIKVASLHNEEDIHRKDIRIGDWVVVERAGEVIPQVIGPVPTRRSGNEKKFKMPETCTVCATTVVKSLGDAVHRCPNVSCPAQFSELFRHFVSKDAMDIQGLGDRWSQLLIERGLVKDLADLYYISRDSLVALDRMGEKLATKIMDNRDASKNRPLSKVIFALGIPHVGSEIADLITQHLHSVDEIQLASEEQLTNIQGIGPKIAASVVSYFSVEKNIIVIHKLKDAGVRLHHKPAFHNLSAMSLQGILFCLTGSLSSMSRSYARSEIEALGGSWSSNVSSKTTYLVVGSNPGSKLEQANKLGIGILDEDQFIALLASREARN